MSKGNKNRSMIRSGPADDKGNFGALVNGPEARRRLERLKDLNWRIFYSREEIDAAERVNINWKAQGNYIGGYGTTSDAPFSEKYIVARKQALDILRKERDELREHFAAFMRVVQLDTDLTKLRPKSLAEQVVYIQRGEKYPADSWREGIADAESVGDGNAVPRLGPASKPEMSAKVFADECPTVAPAPDPDLAAMPPSDVMQGAPPIDWKAQQALDEENHAKDLERRAQASAREDAAMAREAQLDQKQ